MKSRIACLVALNGCLAGSVPANAEKVERPTPPSVSTAAKAPAASLSADEIRTIVRRAHWDLRRQALHLFERADPLEREKSFALCYGDSPATRIAKVSEARNFLAKYVTGRATQCYQSSYFGCTVGEWIGFAGVALLGVESVAHLESKVAVIEQSRDRVVADVSEPPSEYVSEAGAFDRKLYAANGFKDVDKWKSRYTLVRAADGHWLIADRVPNFQWECGDGEPELPPIKAAR